MSSAPRIVITGMGVLCPGAHGLQELETLLRGDRAPFRKLGSLEAAGFACQVGGLPDDIETKIESYLTPDLRFAMNSHMHYAAIAGIDCWRDAGLELPAWDSAEIDWDSGIVLGTGCGGIESVTQNDIEAKIKSGRVRRLGSGVIEQTMMSAASAKMTGLLGLGGRVGTVSSACATGTEAIAEAFFHLRAGRATRMLAGGTEGATEASAPYLWAGFDAMRVLARGWNAEPARASRPMSASASGFVPAAGAGLLMLETLSSAEERGARIYAELRGAHVNSGGQRQGGSITAANPAGVARCIRATCEAADVEASAIDLINAHLTATAFDAAEVRTWQAALELAPSEMPTLQATKAYLGHGLGAAGAWEAIATILQMHRGFLHAPLACEDLHPELEAFAPSIHRSFASRPPTLAIKAGFGFGDVNACIILERWNEHE